MSIAEIIKAWKDEEYRNSLSPEQLSNLPENPVGSIELGDDAGLVYGAASNSRGTCNVNPNTPVFVCSCNCTRPPEANGSCS